ncbi:hypothetical protein [Tenacibaculum agarivorans]|uniref:hypothetical protein n=1 Tax=Tenacibaculum agarivorans TaxID=1908389 RepID=UPI00094BA4B0|nr:hypothetical protein [Tenacibaculum agarivorans]
MNQQNIIEKVKKYLEKRFNSIDESLISYSGIRQNAPTTNPNERKDLHLTHYSLENIEGNPYITNIYTVAIDVKTEKLEYILGQNIMEKIEE